jgi:two-component system, NarL family, invasion response regulator UvrY
MSQISILIVDDHPIVREGYRRLLEMHSEFCVCAEADDAQNAYVLYKKHQPSVVVMDLGLRSVSGIEAVRRTREWDKDARILIFSMHEGAAFALKAFEAGAAGYVRAVIQRNSFAPLLPWRVAGTSSARTLPELSLRIDCPEPST